MILAASIVASPTTKQTTTDIEIKPPAISLEQQPEKEFVRSFVIRSRGGTMNVLSAAATDPALAVALREDMNNGAYVVTATLPPGYKTPVGQKVEILVKTDLKANPVLHMPVRVLSDSNSKGPGWVGYAKSKIGQELPKIEIYRVDGELLTIQAVPNKVTVIVFSAHWCGHCDRVMPDIEAIWKDYGKQGVQFYGIAANAGNGEGIRDTMKRWGVDWPWGVDYGYRTIGHFGIVAYPVIIVAGRDGVIQAVHGRISNDEVGNGLDDIDKELRAELDLLIGGGSREDFPDWEALRKAAATSRPATVRPEQPVLTVKADDRKPTTKAGGSVVFKTQITNPGMNSLKLAKVTPSKDVVVRPECVREVPAGGVAVLLCEVKAPDKPGAFSRQVKIETNDPKNPVAEVTLVGTVAK